MRRFMDHKLKLEKELAVATDALMRAADKHSKAKTAFTQVEAVSKCVVLLKSVSEYDCLAQAKSVDDSFAARGRAPVAQA